MVNQGMLTVYVTDLERSVKFYSDVLGMTVKMHFPGHYAQVEIKGLTIGLHPTSPKSPKAGNSESLSIGLSVEDIHSEMKLLIDKGVNFSGDVIDDVQILLAFFKDPDGNPLYLAQSKMKW